MIQLHYNDWAAPWYSGTEHDYLIVEGGRGASKTHEITQALAYRGALESLRICVAREHLNSINESAKPELEARMATMGILGVGGWTATNQYIDHANGSHIFFIGLSKVSEEDIKGLALVDLLWIEEAQRMSLSSWILIRPTIRKDGAQVWASYNAKRYSDPIYEYAHGNTENPRVLFKQVTWRDNAFFTARNERERLDWKRNEPETYQHEWEGVPYGDGDVRKVITYEMAMACVNAWKEWVIPNNYQPSGRVDVGLDVADTGTNRNALVARKGPVLFHAERFSKPIPADTARYADGWCRREGVGRMYYDTQPAGAIRGPLSELVRQVGKRPYAERGVFFGGEVEGKEVDFNLNVTNKDMFFNRSAQMYWGLHLRARNTQRLLAGKTNIRPNDCLFIDPTEFRESELNVLIKQLSQVEWEETTNGKTRVIKQPKETEGRSTVMPSPDLADATALAFSRDSDDGRGLKARR